MPAKENLTPLELAEQVFVLLAALFLSYQVGRASLPFGAQFTASYLLTRTVYDTLRRVHRLAVLLAVAALLALSMLGARHEQAALLSARLAWHEAEQATVAACHVPGSQACLHALDQERVAASKLCEVSRGLECP